MNNDGFDSQSRGVVDCPRGRELPEGGLDLIVCGRSEAAQPVHQGQPMHRGEVDVPVVLLEPERELDNGPRPFGAQPAIELSRLLAVGHRHEREGLPSQLEQEEPDEAGRRESGCGPRP